MSQQTTQGIAAPQTEVLPESMIEAGLPIILKRQEPETTSPDVTVRGVFTADLTLMKLLRLQEQIDEVESLYQQELEFLERWRKQRLSVLQNEYDYHASSVQAWLSISGKRSVKLPHGDIGFRKQPVKVEIINEDKILLQPEFVRIKRSPDKTAIMKAYKEHGLIPDGTDIIEQEDKFYVKLNPLKGGDVVQSEN